MRCRESMPGVGGREGGGSTYKKRMRSDVLQNADLDWNWAVSSLSNDQRGWGGVYANRDWGINTISPPTAGQ